MNQLDVMAGVPPAALAASFERVVERARAQNTAAGCCQNGSQLVPTQQERIWIVGSAICAVLGTVWTPLAGALCEVLVPILLDLGPICSQCPPAPVAPPWNDIWATGLLPIPNQLLDWATSTFISQNWNTWCQCIGGTGCGSTQATDTINGSPYSIVYGTSVIPYTPTATAVSVQYSYSVVNAPGASRIQISYQNAAGVQLVSDVVSSVVAAGGTGTYTTTGLTNPSYNGLARVQFAWYCYGNPQPAGMQLSLSTTTTWSGCSNPTTGYTPPPVIQPPANIPNPPPLPTGCTTDQLCQKITYTEQMLDNISRMLDLYLIPPHSWQEGAVHAGLSGNGSFPLFSNSRGIKAVITTIPSRQGGIVGSPNRLFDVGWLTAAGAEGPYDTWDLDFQTQVMVLPPLSSTLYYSIPSDVVITVTELVQGP